MAKDIRKEFGFLNNPEDSEEPVFKQLGTIDPRTFPELPINHPFNIREIGTEEYPEGSRGAAMQERLREEMTVFTTDENVIKEALRIRRMLRGDSEPMSIEQSVIKAKEIIDLTSKPF